MSRMISVAAVSISLMIRKSLVTMLDLRSLGTLMASSPDSAYKGLACQQVNWAGF